MATGTRHDNEEASESAQAERDAKFMAIAMTLGRRGLGQTWPNPAVGALVVRENGLGPMIVGRGWTQPGGRPHAEPVALAAAGSAARGATLYVTLEPCSHHGKSPPCADAVIAAGITRVVAAIEDPNPRVAGEGHSRLRAAGITVDVGVGAREALRAHSGHIRRIRDGRPHVFLKLAVSVDGKAGLADRLPVSITGETARRHVHMMRAMHDAILSGIGTVLADDPMLTCRLPGMAIRSPVRVVLDGRLRLPVSSNLATSARETPVWVVCSHEASREREAELVARGVEVIRVHTAGGRLDLVETLHRLAERGITRLMVEAGPILCAALVKADLVDEAALFRAPMAIGADGIDALEGLPLTALTQTRGLTSLGRATMDADSVEFFERN